MASPRTPFRRALTPSSWDAAELFGTEIGHERKTRRPPGVSRVRSVRTLETAPLGKSVPAAGWWWCVALDLATSPQFSTAAHRSIARRDGQRFLVFYRNPVPGRNRVSGGCFVRHLAAGDRLDELGRGRSGAVSL